MSARTLLLTTLVMLTFAGNSLLCRAALRDASIDPASFTTLRLVSGSLALWLLLRLGSSKRPAATGTGSPYGAIALFVYAAALSFAYVGLDAGAGALLLFGAVQLSMVAWGLWRGERLGATQLVGMLLAIGGLVALLLPGSHAPSLGVSLLMLLSGAAWGAYSLLGRGTRDPLSSTASNFLLASPLAILLSLAMFGSFHWSPAGVLYAVLSGALTSGIGYAVWYTVLPRLAAIQAASVQLCVPLLTAVAGSLLLGEALTLHLLLAGAAILGGVALVLRARQAS